MRPLSFKKRISVLILMFVIFILGAPIIILYSAGYRLNDALSLVQTGGIFIHSDLSGTKIYLDDDFIEKNGLILKNTLIQDLRPNRSYYIRIEKEGHHTWTKELFVFPNLVTEGQVLMLPTDIKFRDIEKNVILQPEINSVGTSQLIKEIENPEYASIEGLFDPERLSQFEVIVSTTTPRIIRGQTQLALSTTTEIVLPDFIEKMEIKDFGKKNNIREKQKVVTWLEGGVVHVVWAGEKEATPYFFCLEECNQSIDISFGKGIEYYDFLPGRNDVLIVSNENGIYAIEIDNRSIPNIQPILEGSNLSFRVKDNNVIFIKQGDIFKEVLI